MAYNQTGNGGAQGGPSPSTDLIVYAPPVTAKPKATAKVAEAGRWLKDYGTALKHGRWVRVPQPRAVQLPTNFLIRQSLTG